MGKLDKVRVGVLSDSHGDARALERALARMRSEGGVDVLCFLGDCVRDVAIIAPIIAAWEKPPALHVVRGNNDILSEHPAQLCVQAGGKTLLLVHGHLQRVRTHRLQLLLCAQEAGADVALFGHTHQSECGYERGILLLNPGACSGRSPTCAVLSIAAGEMRPEIWD